MKRSENTLTKLRDERDAAKRKSADLRTSRDEAAHKHSELLAALNGRSKEPSNHLADEVLRLLNGNERASTQPSLDSLREQTAQAHQSVQAHELAIQEQDRLADAANVRYSAPVCDAALPKWTELVKGGVDAAVALAQAYQAIYDFRDELIADGVIITLPTLPPHLHAVGRWGDPHANIHGMINEAVKAGFCGEYRDRPQIPAPYDDLPEGTTVAGLAAGPDGIRDVQIARGGKLTKKKWLYQSEQSATARPDDWAH